MPADWQLMSDEDRARWTIKNGSREEVRLASEWLERHTRKKGKAIPPRPLLAPDGRKATREDVLRAASSDVVIRTCLQLYEHDYCTYEEALMGAVLVLADANNRLVQELVDASLRQKTVYLKSISDAE